MLFINDIFTPLIAGENIVIENNAGIAKIELAGEFMFELWGAAADHGRGGGAYTKGKTTFLTRTILYAYTGGTISPYFNGGAHGYSDSLGATDIRIIRGNSWSDFNSLASRIMVAATPGTPQYTKIEGYAGGLSGEKAPQGSKGTPRDAGHQTWGGGTFGKGSDGTGKKIGGAGGAGYYGGGGYASSTSYSLICGGGSGGSSFISGHPGCDAVVNDISLAHSGQPNHYSGIIFTETQMINGNATMPNPYTTGTMVGNHNSGKVRITFLSGLNKYLINV